MPLPKKLRRCPKGHRYDKTSDCPVCPVCEAAKKPKDGFLATISAPARRALQRMGISTLKELSLCTETHLLAQHGFGPGSIPILKKHLHAKGLSFRKN
jgi:hypothetical protein